MLEYDSLCVASWSETSSPDSRSSWVRHISDAQKNPVGFVRLDGKIKSFWFSWLGRTRLEVFETTDASHLMSLERSWGVWPFWQMYDADERSIGYFCPPRLLDTLGAQRGILEDQMDHGSIYGPEHQELARFHKKAPGFLELSLTVQAEPNPFLRMLMLGSVLTLDTVPAL